MLKVHVSNHQKVLRVSAACVRKTVRTAAPEEWADREISVALVSGDEMSSLNHRYTGRATDADVLAFPLADPDDGLVGEIVVSTSRAELEAADRHISALDELALYLVHGVLHLCGYDDHDPGAKRKMYARENAILHRMGMPDVRRSPRRRSR